MTFIRKISDGYLNQVVFTRKKLIDLNHVMFKSDQCCYVASQMNKNEANCEDSLFYYHSNNNGFYCCQEVFARMVIAMAKTGYNRWPVTTCQPCVGLCQPCVGL